MAVLAPEDHYVPQTRRGLAGLAAVAREAWPPGAAGRVLLGLVVAGVALRGLSLVSLWPTTILEDGYQLVAKTQPFSDPKHPAGYALILAAIGAVTHQILVPIVLQHLSGIASALVTGAATRRLTGSSWVGLIPAAIILLDADQVFLEHSIMSESWVVLATSIGLYATVRALDERGPSLRWPLLAGTTLAIGVMIRSADLPLLAIAVLVLLVGPKRPVRSWRPQWRGPLAAGGVAVVLLLAFAGANDRYGTRFGIAPAPGWYLYGRAAQFADCTRFTPPPGTAGLCQTTSPSRRPSGYYYMFLPQAPAPRQFGAFGSRDALLGTWARRAVQAQLGDFLATAWSYLRSYYVPATLPARLRPLTTKLDPQLDFAYTGNVFYVAAIHDALEAFFQKFTMHRFGPGITAVRAWQRVFRFGATLLFITTLLTLAGLVIGRFRARLAAFLFGVGGLSLLIAPVLTGTYSGRYTVPMAGPLMAAGAAAIGEIWWRHRRPVPAPRPSSP